MRVAAGWTPATSGRAAEAVRAVAASPRTPPDAARSSGRPSDCLCPPAHRRGTTCAGSGAGRRAGGGRVTAAPPPRAAGGDGVEGFTIGGVRSEEQLQEEQKWVAVQVTAWLNEEWTPLEVHERAGTAAGHAYARLRRGGATEMADLVLGLSAELLQFDFHDTFTSAFEVSNKVVELVMMRAGCDVCCTSDGDRERMDRISLELQAGHPTRN